MSHAEAIPHHPSEDQSSMGASEVEAPVEPEVAQPPLSIAERNGGYTTRGPGVYEDTVGHLPPGGYVETNQRILDTQALLARRREGPDEAALARIAAIKSGDYVEALDTPVEPERTASPAPPVGESLVAIDHARRKLAEQQEIATPQSADQDDLPIEGRNLTGVPRRVDGNGPQPGETAKEPTFTPQPIIRRSDRQPTGSPADEVFANLNGQPQDVPPSSPPAQPGPKPEYPSYHPITRLRNEQAGGEYYEDF